MRHYLTSKDGTVLNSNTLLSKAPNTESRFKNFGLSLASIVKATYTDDKNNKKKKGVEYQAVLLNGPRAGSVIKGLRPLDMFGGDENYNEVVYKPKTRTLKGKDKGDKTIPEHTDASMVLVGFVDGHYNNPVILGGFPNPNNANVGKNKSDGVSLSGSFNGLNWSIDSDGKLKIDRGNTFIELDTGGNINITTSNNATITSTGDTAINSTGDTTVTSSGNLTTTSSGPTSITGTGGVSFLGPSVDIGGSGGEKVVKGDTLKAWLDAHTHPGTGAPITPLPGGALSSKSKVV